MRQARAKANRTQRWLPVLVFLMTLSASAQMQPPPKLIVISVPDRKLALLEDGRVLKVYPVAVGGGKRFLPDGVRLDLELVEERRFGKGVVLLRCAVRG